jgi:hypothetical protein
MALVNQSLTNIELIGSGRHEVFHIIVFHGVRRLVNACLYSQETCILFDHSRLASDALDSDYN